MEVFGFAGLFGLILGFMFGVGCALAVMYSIYMGGYRKAVSDSLEQIPSERLQKELNKLRARATTVPRNERN
jgi:hypothetical protein